MASTDLELVIRASDQASKTLGDISKKAGGLANVMGKALKTGALVGGAALIGAGVASVKMGLDFEKSMAEVKTLLPDIGDKAFGAIKSDVLDLSKELGLATSDAIPALYQAISAGIPPDNVIDFLRTAGKAAIGGVTDIETAVDGITSVVNAYAGDALEAGKVSDVMFTAVRLGKTTFDELAQSLFNVLPTASSLGITFEEVAAALATMTAQGIPTSVATTQLKQLFVEASKSGTKFDQALRDMAGKGLTELIAEGATATGVFEQLRASMSDEEFRNLFGSTEAMNAALALTGPNAEAMAAGLDEAIGSAGASDTAFDTMADTMSFKLNKAINLLKVTLTEVGIKILPTLTKALEKVVPWLEKNLPKGVAFVQDAFRTLRPIIERTVEVFSDLINAGRKVFDFLKENKPILAGIAAAILTLLVPGIIAWTVATIANTAAHIALAVATIVAYAPLIALAVGIGILVAGIILLIKHWDDVVAAMKKAADFIVETAGKIKDFLVGAFEKVLDFLKENWPLILAIITGPIGLIVLAIITFKDDIIRVFGEVITWVKDLPGKILAALGDFGGLLLQKGKDLVQGFLNGIQAVWSGLSTWIADTSNRILRLVGSMAATLWTSGWNLITGFWNGIIRQWTRLTEWIRGKLKDLAGMFTGFLGIGSPSRLFEGIGENMMKGLIQGLEGQSVKLNATVGNVTGGIAGAAAGASDFGRRTARAAHGGDVHLHINSRFPPDRRALRAEAGIWKDELERLARLGAV